MYGSEPPVQNYTRDFEMFKSTPYGQKAAYLPDFNQNIRLTEERTTSEGYRNIRELD
jgi:hypothetical protein